MHSNRENTKLAFRLFVIQHFKNVFCCCYLHNCVMRLDIHKVFCSMLHFSFLLLLLANLSAEDLIAVSFQLLG